MHLLPALYNGWSSITHDQQFPNLTSFFSVCLYLIHSSWKEEETSCF
jgi:hypothetical protein